MKLIERLKRLGSRRVARQVIKYVPIQRGFDAAKWSASLANWTGTGTLSQRLVRSELGVIREKVLDLYCNSPLTKRAMQIYLNNIVGNGFALSASVKGEDGVEEIAKSDKVEDAFNRWASNPRYCDTAKQSTFTQILKQAVQSWMLAGEAFIRITRGRGDNPFGFSLSLVNPDAVAIDRCQTLYGGAAIENGVEVDGDGVVVAYHVYTLKDINGKPYGPTVRVPAADILHLFTPDTIGQRRGFPVFSNIAGTIKQLDAYRVACIVAARLASCQVGVYKATDANAVDVLQVSDKVGADEIPTQAVEAGNSIICPEGWDYINNSPQFPQSTYQDFVASLVRDVSSGLGVSYVSLSQDLAGVSYSSIRQSELENRRNFVAWQNDLVDCVIRPMFRGRGNWLDGWALRADVSAMDIEAMRESDTWLGQRWSNIDPQSEMSAYKTAIELGLTTATDLAASMGNDYYRNLQTVADEAKWKAKVGLDKGNKEEAKRI